MGSNAPVTIDAIEGESLRDLPGCVTRTIDQLQVMPTANNLATVAIPGPPRSQVERDRRRGYADARHQRIFSRGCPVIRG